MYQLGRTRVSLALLYLVAIRYIFLHNSCLENLAKCCVAFLRDAHPFEPLDKDEFEEEQKCPRCDMTLKIKFIRYEVTMGHLFEVNDARYA